VFDSDFATTTGLGQSVVRVEGTVMSSLGSSCASYIVGSGVIVAPRLLATSAYNNVYPPKAEVISAEMIGGRILVNDHFDCDLSGRRPTSVVSIWELERAIDEHAKLAQNSDHIGPGSEVTIIGYGPMPWGHRLGRALWIRLPLPQVHKMATVVERTDNGRLVTDCPQWLGAGGAAVFDKSGLLVGLCTNLTGSSRDACLVISPVVVVHAMIAEATS